jgi:hypothetical protein
MLTDAYDELVTNLGSMGLPVFSNVQALRPPGVVVDPPNITSMSATLIELTYKISVVAAPPGDYRAVQKILDMADTIVENLTDASRMTSTAGVYAVGNQELPTYQLSATITYRRN